jgi:hypothetical protein
MLGGINARSASCSLDEAVFTRGIPLKALLTSDWIVERTYEIR